MPIRLKTSIFSFGLICLLSIANTAYSQSFSNQHWYFGNNNIAVEFERPNDVPAIIRNYKTPPFNNLGIGNATANKPETGDLLFYTDGFDIFDASFVRMVGATTTNLNADVNKNQSVAISSVPGNNDRYFIFTNTTGAGVQVSTIDMAANGNAILLQPPLGRVVDLNLPIANSTATPSDAMIVLANANNDGYWLITLDQGTNDYKVLTIDSATPGSWTETIYPGEGAVMDAAHFTFNADSSRIAVAPKSSNVNIQLLDFDIATGVLTFDKDIPNSGNADFGTEAIFDVAFSNDGSKLYYSSYGDETGSIGNLMQFDLFDTIIVLSPQSVIPATVFGSYGLQKGPDGNLYHLYQATNGGPFLIGSLTDIDSVANLTTYTPAIENGEDFSSFQFPAFLPNRAPAFSELTFTSAGNCANAPTSFFPNISPAPTSVQWDFGDGSTSADFAPFYTYTAGGPMTVTMRAQLNGQSRTFSQTVDITDFQLQLTLPQDTVACQCELPKYAPLTCTQFSVTVQGQGGSGSETYAWSNGQTGVTLNPDSAGYYYVVATDPISGCSTYAGVQVQEYDTNIPGIAPSQRSNIWYFGNQAGIDFNNGAIAITDGAMDAMEGCTAVSDRNGQIIFYTDGDILFDQTHTQIDTGLGGTPNLPNGTATQSVIAVAVPGDETLFYIFTTQNTDPTSPDYNFSYSLFDLKANNGLGAVVEKNVVLFNKSTERIAATANWVIMHEYGNNNFRAYPISATGVGNAVVSSTGEDYSIISAENGKGYMKLGGSNLGLAVVENNNGTPNNYLDVYDFDAGSGEVSNLRRADLTAAGANGQAYGIEFVGPKIFVTITNGASSQIMEYWLDFNGDLQIITGMNSPGVEVGAIQTGPDGQIYVAENGSATLGTISVSGDTLQPSQYNASSFSLAGQNSQLGLPNFIQQSGTAGSAPGISVSSPACIGQPIFLSANLTSSIDSVEWQITDPTGAIVYTSSNFIDTLTLNVAGDHIASLLIKNRCLSPIASFSEIITISPPPDISDLPVNTFLCGTDVTLPVYTVPPTNMADLDFAWSTGETTPSITVTAQGNYDVIITDRTSGCITLAATFVGPPLPIDVGPDQTICENDPLTLDSQVNADTYVWTINGTAQPGTRFFDFGALGLAGGTYTVQVDATIDLGGSIGPCTVIDQTIITVNGAPVFTGIQTAATTCGAATGQIAIDITSIGSFNYTIATESGTITGPSTGNPVSNIPAGVNVLTLTNTVTGCIQTGNVTVIDDALFEITDAQPVDATCSRDDGQITFDVGSGAIGAFTATVRDINDPALIYTQNYNPGGNGSFIFDNPTPVGLLPSDYTLEIQEDGGMNCTAIWINGTSPPVAQTLIIGSPLDTDLQILINPVLGCSGPIDLSDPTIVPVTNWTLLEWSDDNGATYQDASTTPYPGIGDNPVLLRASSATTCNAERPINVINTPPPSVDIDVSGDSCDGQLVLTATVTDPGYAGSNLGFRWNTSETSQSITVTQSGDYQVTAFHTINQQPSCSDIKSQTIIIPEPFTVAVSSTLACDDGKPITLTATVSNAGAKVPTWFLNGVDIGRNQFIITVFDEGDYSVVVEDTGSGCTSNGLLTVTRIPLTPTNLSSAPVFCPADSVLTLDAGPNFVSYLWSDGSTSQTLEVSVGGIYTLEATNDFGCVTEDQSEAIEDCIPKISGPNAFRPGGANPTYSLFTEYVDTFEIFIYNRWGEMVYNSSDASFAWDGTYNGALLPAGQYSWVVRYTSSFRDRGTIETYGGVVLLR